MAPIADRIVGIEFYATTNPVFFAGKLLNGIMIGAIGSVMISYIGEVSYSNRLETSTGSIAH